MFKSNKFVQSTPFFETKAFHQQGKRRSRPGLPEVFTDNDTPTDKLRESKTTRQSKHPMPTSEKRASFLLQTPGNDGLKGSREPKGR